MMGLDLLVSDLDNTALACRPKSMRRGDPVLDPQSKQTDTVSLCESVCRFVSMCVSQSMCFFAVWGSLWIVKEIGREQESDEYEESQKEKGKNEIGSDEA